MNEFGELVKLRVLCSLVMLCSKLVTISKYIFVWTEAVMFGLPECRIVLLYFSWSLSFSHLPISCLVPFILQRGGFSDTVFADAPMQSDHKVCTKPLCLEMLILYTCNFYVRDVPFSVVNEAWTINSPKDWLHMLENVFHEFALDWNYNKDLIYLLPKISYICLLDLYWTVSDCTIIQIYTWTLVWNLEIEVEINKQFKIFWIFL